MKQIFFLLAIPVLIFSCKKESFQCHDKYIDDVESDTIFSSDYLMLYPGSEWNFDNGTSLTCDEWASVNIMGPSWPGPRCKVRKRTAAVVSHSYLGYIQGNDQLVFNGDEMTGFNTIIDSVPGQLYSYQRYTSSGDGRITYSANVVEFMNSMEVSGITYQDIVHISYSKYTFYFHVSSGPLEVTDYYFAKNIGPVKTSYTWGGYPPVVRNLVSYTIGPH